MKTNLRKRSTAFMAILIAIIMSICSMSILAGCDTTESSDTITLNKTTLELTEGSSETLTWTLSNESSVITWTSSDKSVATVSRGKVTAVSVGKATIKASISETVSASCEVTVKADDRTISLDQTTATVDVKDTTTLTLTATTSDNSKAEWSSSDSSLATVDQNGVVTLKKTLNLTAEVTITAKIPGSTKTASCVVTVNNTGIPADYARLNKNNSKINLIGTPDEFQYFLKSAHTNRVTFDDSIAGGNVPYLADGKYTFEMSEISTDTVGMQVTEKNEAGEDVPVVDENGNPVMEYEHTELYLRYQPGKKVGLAQGDIYTVTFKVKANEAGEFKFSKGSEKVQGLGSNISTDDEIDPETVLKVEANKEYTVTLTQCLVDDDSDGKGEPLQIWPRIFTKPENENLLVQIWDFNFEKTGHEDSIGSAAQLPEGTYKLTRASNDNEAIATKGKWTYYIAKNSREDANNPVSAEGTADDTSLEITFKNFDNVTSGNLERLYYTPDGAAGTNYTVSFTIKCNVAGKLAQGIKQELTANEEVTVTATVEGGKTLRIDLIISEKADVDVTFTITNFTCTAVTAE